ncbi:MAG: hypothetical protein M3Y53_02555 [Thermoproteota archaeon]|nr:hypothetical protein [Thermoproteota archaeon]
MPTRLFVIKNCITVTGKVYSSAGTKYEPDGDLRFTLQLDPQFASKGYSTPVNCNLKDSNSPGFEDVVLQTSASNTCDRGFDHKKPWLTNIISGEGRLHSLRLD